MSVENVRDSFNELVELAEGCIEDNIKLNGLLSECEKKKKIALDNWLKNSELYYEYLGKDNDWRYCLKRGLHLLWLNIKIDIMHITHFIPIRG